MSVLFLRNSNEPLMPEVATKTEEIYSKYETEHTNLMQQSVEELRVAIIEISKKRSKDAEGNDQSNAQPHESSGSAPTETA